MTPWTWLRTLLSGRPHFAIGGESNPYMLRWYLIPRNRWINVYLHKFVRDDDDRALHDHPWWFVSLMLWGSYREFVEPFWARFKAVGCFVIDDQRTWVDRRAPSIAFRQANHRHRVELFKRPDGTPIPCWTIVITGPKVREWGFWCPKGFVPWWKFVDRDDHGNIGPGCGGDA